MLNFSKYFCKRFCILLLTAVLASLFIFLALNILPGDVASVIAGSQASVEDIARIRETLGLNQPLILQYFNWLFNFFSGNLGVSKISGIDNLKQFQNASLVTIQIASISLFWTVVFGFILPILIQFTKTSEKLKTTLHNFKYGSLQNILLFISAIPTLYILILGILMFGKGTGFFSIFPTSGVNNSSSALFFPSLLIGIICGAKLMRFVNNSLVESSNKNYVYNFASGSTTWKTAVLKSGLRAQFTPILNVLVLTASELISGVVIVEKLFVFKGIGSILVEDVLKRDLVKVQSEVFLLVLLVLLIGFILDLVIGLIDIRAVRDGGKIWRRV